MSMGSSDNLLWGNDIVIDGEDENYAIYIYRGNDEPDVEGSDGRPKNNRVFDNTLRSDNAVVMMRNADDNIIEVRERERASDRETERERENKNVFFCVEIAPAYSMILPSYSRNIVDQLVNTEHR